MNERDELEALRQLDHATSSGDERLELQALRMLEQFQGEQKQSAQPAVDEDLRSFGDLVIGGAETIGTLATGTIAEPFSGLAGIGQAISSAISGDDVLDDVVNRIESVREGLTFEPVTKTGQEVLGVVAKPFQALAEGADAAGDGVLSSTGSPAAATAAKTVIEGLPGLVGVRIPGAKTAKDLKEIASGADDLGIDLGAKSVDKTTQIKEAGATLVGNNSAKGFSFPDIQNKVKEAKNLAISNRNRLYEEARSSKAAVPVRSFEGLNESISASLQSFDIDTMPIVQKRLAEIEGIKNLPETASLKLNEIDKFRQRIISNRPAFKNESEAFALDIIKGQVDAHIDDLFNSDMISGDPLAVSKWKEARQAHSAYKKNFKEDKVLKAFAEKEATPEEMRQWVFGASLTGAKKQSANTVSKLKELIGENSPEFRALRQDALLDIIDPLLGETPDFKSFVKKYDTLVKNNKSLSDQLFPESAKNLKLLRDIANNSDNFTPAQSRVRIERMGAVVLFGHGIARAGMKVKLAEKAFSAIKGVRDSSRRRQAIADILGYDAAAPILTKKVFGIPAAGQAAASEAEQINQQITAPNSL